MLIFCLILLVVCVITAILAYSSWAYDHDLEPVFGIISVVVGFALFISVLVCAIAPVSWRADIAEFKSVKSSIENARASNLSELERVSIQDKIISENKWLARSQYADAHYWIECIPSEIQDLEPIK
jgi:hypothetical protein